MPHPDGCERSCKCRHPLSWLSRNTIPFEKTTVCQRQLSPLTFSKPACPVGHSRRTLLTRSHKMLVVEPSVIGLPARPVRKSNGLRTLMWNTVQIVVFGEYCCPTISCGIGKEAHRIPAIVFVTESFEVHWFTSSILEASSIATPQAPCGSATGPKITTASVFARLDQYKT